MQGLRQLVSRSTIFVVAEFLQMGAGFLLIPLYTAYLSAADYGIIALASTIGGVLSIFMFQPFQGMFTRLYYDFSDDDERRRFYGSTWFFLIGYVLLCATLLDLIGGAAGTLGFAQLPYHPFLRLTVWTTAISVIVLSLPRALFLVREQAWRLVGLNLSSFGISTSLIIYFVAFKGEGAYGNLHGMFLGTLIVGLPLLIVTLRNISPAWHWKHIRHALAFTLPLIPHMLSLWILNLSDRWILQYYVSLTEIGIYSFGYLFGSIIQIIALSVSEAISPYYYRVAGEHTQAQVLLTRLATYYMAIVIWAAVGLVAMAREVISLIAMRPEYHAAATVIPWVVLGCVARGFYFIFIGAVYHAKSLTLLPVITIVAGLVNIGLNLLLVPLWGIIAAAITTFIAYVLQAILIYWLAQRSFPLRYEYQRLIVISLLGLVWGWPLCSFVLPNVWMSLMVKLMLALTFPLALIALRFFTAEELATARQLWRSFWHVKARS